MKKLLSTLLVVALAVNIANANTNVELKLSGDFYYATDNHFENGLGERPFASSNLFKDRFGTNNLLFEVDAHGDK